MYRYMYEVFDIKAALNLEHGTAMIVWFMTEAPTACMVLEGPKTWNSQVWILIFLWCRLWNPKVDFFEMLQGSGVGVRAAVAGGLLL